MMNVIRLYNTATRSKEELEVADGTVRLYTCGPTVYLDPHIGNWRTFIFYDTLARTLRLHGYDPLHVLNITDVGHLVSDDDEGEDKLATTAAKQRKTAWEVAEHYTQRFVDGMDQLNIISPSYMPRATDHIQEQIALIQQLEAKNFTYRIDDGIYFDTAKLDDYGKLAGLDKVELLEGARVEANAQKRNKTDFALWKFSPADATRDMEWESPWGVGFPGWHLECSAMAMKYLGATMDIHAGGVDHIPVHHTNEIAQSEAATGEPFARIWLHSEFMQVDDAKMAKSAGNGFLIDDIIARDIDPLAFRLFILQSHYRTQSNFTWEALEAAANRLHDLEAFADLRWQILPARNSESPYVDIEAIKAALADDLNTPRALALINTYVAECMDQLIHDDASDNYLDVLELIDEAFGLKLTQREDISQEQKSLIAQREQARDEKDWAEADRIRDLLSGEGIQLRDVDAGTIWSRS